jgi:exodeoxyribonuclease VII large subunit
LKSLPPNIDSDVLTVSQLNVRVREAIEQAIPPVWVRGEISNFVLHSSGHMYFSLKDEQSQLRAVMFRNQNRRLSFSPANGSEVIAFGRVSVYERIGQHQLYVEELVPAGLGALQAAFEALKKKLAAEGLFDASRKRALPEYPETIGVVTSPTGAAIRDIVNVLRRRQPSVQIVLRPTIVQGEGSARDIVQAIAEMNDCGVAEVLIVGRGGGSLEDLWSFNEETVARAISESSIPVVSAVGHEVDFTIADMAADVRAPTPSAAAEIVVKDSVTVRERIGQLWNAACARAGNRHELVSQRLAAVLGSYGLRRPEGLLIQLRQRLDDLVERLQYRAAHVIERRKTETVHLLQRLRSVDPQQVLKRGYSICRKWPGGPVVFASSDIARGERVELSFYEGGAVCRVERKTGDKEEGRAATQETIF